MQRRLRVMICHIKDAPRKPLAEATILLKPDLRWSLKLQRHNETSDAGDILSHAESPDQLKQPVSIHYYIIVGKGQYLSLCCRYSSISRPGCSWTVFTNIAYPGHVAVRLLYKNSSRICCGRVIYHNDFIMGIL